jgi:thymidine kinase
LRTVAGALARRCIRAALRLTRLFCVLRADSRTELVGGSEAYQPACRACYNEMHRAAASVPQPSTPQPALAATAR